MAQIQPQPATREKKNRRMHARLHIDMTPMVDLGFLLITFFIFTTTIAENRAANIVVPDDKPGVEPGKTAVSATVSLLLGKDNRIYYYNGIWEDAVKAHTIRQTSYNVYTGVGQLIRAKQKWLDLHYVKKRDGLVLLIKPTDQSTYQNFVDAIDEVTINGVKTYVVMQPTIAERNYALTN